MTVRREELTRLHNHLNTALQRVISFWVARCWDQDYGGYLTNFDEQGRPLGTPEKYLNTQARLVWWFSTLYRHFPEDQIHKQLAEEGAVWMIEHFWDKRYGGWYWKVNRDGSCLDDGKVVYGQSFAIYALAEYYLATQDQRGLELAARSFDLLQIYCADTRFGGYYENLGPDWTVAPGGLYAGDRKGLDTHMHLMESFTVLARASGLEIHRRKLQEIVDLIVAYMIDPESGCGRNQFSLDFTPLPAIAIHRTWNAERQGDAPEIPTDTTSYGHNLELVWLLNRALEVTGADPTPYQDLMLKFLNHALDHGVDWEFGGVYRDGTATGGALILEKEFWQNAEALVGFLDGYVLFGKMDFLDAFMNIWHFVNRFMIIPDVGEWRTLLDRQGNPIDPKIGNPWKVAYHSGRALLECVKGLQKIIEGY